MLQPLHLSFEKCVTDTYKSYVNTIVSVKVCHFYHRESSERYITAAILRFENEQKAERWEVSKTKRDKYESAVLDRNQAYA